MTPRSACEVSTPDRQHRLARGGPKSPRLAARRVPSLAWVALLSFALFAQRAAACVGTECFQVWSTEDGGGDLAVEFDFSENVLAFLSFCAGGQCLYSALDPGFIGTPEATPGSGYYRIADGTTVVFEVVEIADGLTISLNGNRLNAAGATANLGTLPDLHNHPSWQLLLPEGVHGDYLLSFRLRAQPARYGTSQVYSVTVTNIEPTPVPATPSATPTATATPGVAICGGDCDGGGSVTVDEILTCVNQALGTVEGCSACDGDESGAVTVDEIIAAVNAGLTGCDVTPPATLAEIQRTIFTPRCATSLCHDAASAGGDLVLVDGRSHEALVGVVPTALIAAQAGQLRVDPGNPGNSFLIAKLVGPPPGTGSRMPLLGELLSDAEVDTIRRWILHGALP